MLFNHQCDDSITNRINGVGGIVRNPEFRNACDKCVQDNAGPLINTSTCQGRRCFHMDYQNNTFSGCTTPMRMTQGDGEFTARNGVFRVLGGTFDRNTSGGQNFPCINGIWVGAQRLQMVIEDVNISNCGFGIQMGGSLSGDTRPAYVLHHNQVKNENNSEGKAGVVVQSAASALLTRNIITGNGRCCGSGTANRGGVVLINSAIVDIQGNTQVNPPHGNRICDNKLSGNVFREIDNRRTDYTVPATNNWWCNGAGGGPKGFFGSVDWQPALQAQPPF